MLYIELIMKKLIQQIEKLKNTNIKNTIDNGLTNKNLENPNILRFDRMQFFGYIVNFFRSCGVAILAL